MTEHIRKAGQVAIDALIERGGFENASNDDLADYMSRIVDACVSASKGNVQVAPIELLALKKMAVINDALAKSIRGQAGVEQAALTGVLIDIIRRADLSFATS